MRYSTSFFQKRYAVKPAEKSYPPRVVCRLLNIPPGTLATWASRRYFDNFDGQTGARGKARMFSRADVLALALIKAASDWSLMPVSLPGFSPKAARFYLANPARITELVIQQWPEPEARTAIRYNDDVMQKPRDTTSSVTITYNLAKIFGDAITLLDAHTDKATEAYEAWVEETDPLLDDQRPAVTEDDEA
jgi:hypothetical protein